MRIAIAGFGIEGRSNYAYFRRVFPDAEVVIVDEHNLLENLPSEVDAILGDDAFSQLNDFDMVVRTAGLPPRKIVTTGKIWSATNEFFARCAEKDITIIGVTGTKGKGTTSSLIASILRVAGKTVHLVGNIGVPALEVLSQIKPGDIVVYELSSFQLWDLERSPQIAVVLMIEPDHLDVHADFTEYILAKSRITRFQNASDRVIYHPTNRYSQSIAGSSDGRKQRYGAIEDGGVYVAENTFFVQKNAICGVDTLHLAGVHNWENACAAISAVLAVAPDATNGQIATGLSSFKGLSHRLKLIAEVRGVKYYDDSIATTPGSAIAALRAFDAPKIIILGGSDKGASYDEVITVAKETGARVIAVGQTGQIIYELCQQQGVTVEREEGLMHAVVERASRTATPGSVVILSPASASFDQYTSYVDRGNQFIEAVNNLKAAPLADQ